MHAAGNLPDHVTRYNHKYESRWLIPPERREISWDGIFAGALLIICIAGLIVSALMILQGVA